MGIIVKRVKTMLNKEILIGFYFYPSFNGSRLGFNNFDIDDEKCLFMIY